RMPSERVQRRVDALLDEADAAVGARNWDLVRDLCDAVLRLDPGNEDALAFLAAAGRDTGVAAPRADARGEDLEAPGPGGRGVREELAAGEGSSLSPTGETARMGGEAASPSATSPSDQDGSLSMAKREGWGEGRGPAGSSSGSEAQASSLSPTGDRVG